MNKRLNFLVILAMVLLMLVLLPSNSSSAATRKKRVRPTRFPTKRPTSAPIEPDVTPGQDDGDDDYNDGDDDYNDGDDDDGYNDEGTNSSTTSNQEYENSTTSNTDTTNNNLNSTEAEVRSDFNIEFLYVDVKDYQKQAFEQAKKRWTSIILGDLPSQVTLVPGTWCGFRIPARRTVDDLLIGVRMVKIDGVGRVLGRAGPCGLDDFGLPRFGVMEFDEDDVDRMIATGTFNNVILHEMGHVLGIGTLWDRLDLIDGSYQPLLYYSGEEGNAGNQDVGRSGRAFVEDDYGGGTAWSHWKEDPPLGYDNELMTGFVEPQGVPMPLSKLTVRALRDIGYVTDASKADPYTAPPFSGRRRLRKTNLVPLEGDTFKTDLITMEAKPKPGRERDFERDRERFKRRRKLLEPLRGNSPGALVDDHPYVENSN